MTSWKSSGTNFIPDVKWTFDVITVAEQWREEVHLANGQSFIVGCDGESVYEVFEDVVNVNAYAGDVFKGTYPIQAFLYTTLPWLAYCSGSTLRSVTNAEMQLPAPWLMAWADPLAHIYKCRIKALLNGHGLPERVEYQADADLVEALKRGHSGTREPPSENTLQHALLQLARRYDGRFTEPDAVYQVTQVTNFQGVVFPSRSSFDRYTLNNTKGGVLRRLHSKTTVELASLETVEQIAPYPRLSGAITNISVADFRFSNLKRGVAFISYVATNSAWRTNEKDPYLQSLNAQKLKAAKPLFISVSRPTAVFVFLAITVLWPLLLPGVRRRLLDYVTRIARMRG